MAQQGAVAVPFSATEAVPVKVKKLDTAYPRWFGATASCVAVVVSHPFDLGKLSGVEGGG